MTSPIVVDRKGNELLQFIRGQEADLGRIDPSIPLPLSLVVAQNDGETLLVFNRWRQEWELPGGMIDPGETARQAAVREFEEETGQQAPPLTYVGVALFRLMPDHRLEYAAVYSGTTSGRQPFTPNDEIEQVTWWDGTYFRAVSELDETIARLTVSPH